MAMIHSGCYAAPVAMIVLFSVWEIVVRYPLPPWLYLGAVVIGLVSLTWSEPLAFRQRKSLAMIAYIALLAILHLTPWSERKEFFVDSRSIGVGMAEARTREIMSGYAIAMQTDRRIVFRNSSSRRYDSDLLILEIDPASRTVVRKQILSD